MKRKNKIIVLIIMLLVILSLFFLYYFFSKNKNMLSISEKQWIDENKNNVIDISVLSDIPAFTNNGNGVVFDFLNYVSKETNLNFNTSAFKMDDTVLSDYSFVLKDKKEGNDILVYKDNYVMIGLNENVNINPNNVSKSYIGVLTADKDKFSKYFNDTNVLKTYNNKTEIFNDISNLNYIILLKTDVMKFISQKNLSISYEFLSETKDYVITLNGNKDLNGVLKKYYNKFYNSEYDNSYSQSLINDYYYYNSISTLKQTDLRSKTYTYGFVEEGIYDRLDNNSLKGINNFILKSFSNFSLVEIKYKKYDTIKDLVEDYENGKIDIILNNNDFNIKKDSLYSKTDLKVDIVALSDYSNSTSISNIHDLENYKVAVVKNSKIASILKTNNIKYKSYKNFKDLLKHKSKNEIVVVEFENYDYYKTRDFKNYKVDFIINNVNYNYIINNSNNNSTFASLFNFYINYNNLNKMIKSNYDKIAYITVDYFYVMLAIIAIILLMLIFSLIKRIRLLIKKIMSLRKKTLTKEEKLKYIDQLTSLKNRAYLNSKVESWDDSEVYPQCIVVVDLNNVAYINDNFGREEGDKIILQAANILITSQLPNTEIIRTDGNEFLVYLVGYQEKAVISYLKKLQKAFKTLDHGFGAAIGYSMITDAIKTFDDAVNEATIDMRNNKDSN